MIPDESATLTTSEITITESHVVAWASLTGDWLPIHMSEEFAAASEFGRRLVHGPLTFAMAVGLSTRTPAIDPIRTIAWLGLGELRAIKPVFIGDTVRADVRQTSARPARRGNSTIVELTYDVRNHRDELVMTFVNRLLVADEAM